MNNLVIKIRLLSESIFGNGESETNGVDTDILKDEIGVPYFKGKTFKGKLREEAECIKNYLSAGKGQNYDDIINNLFGQEGKFNSNTLKFSNCQISDDIWNDLNYGVQNRKFTKEDITDSLTEIRSFTRLDKDGVAEKGSLREARVIKKNLILYCKVECPRELSTIEKGFLAASTAALKNLGSMESRGKGLVECLLIENGKDVTQKYIDSLEAEI